MTESESIRRYTSISAAIDVLSRRKLAILNPENWDDRNDRYYMALYKEAKRKSGGLYGLCAAQCSETYHHWRVFTNGAEGACIEIYREKLEMALGVTAGVRFGPVKYLTLDEVDQLSKGDVANLPFVKRAAFIDEDEYRIVVETDKPQAPVFYVDFDLHWIKRVHLNPWLPKTIAATMKKIIQRIPGCGGVEVWRSQLIDSSRFKRAGDRVIGRPSPEVDQARPKKQRPKGATKGSALKRR